MKKKQNIIIGCLLLIIIGIFVSFNFLTKTKIPPTKLKGDISSYSGSVWITCSNDTIKVGQTTSCTLMGNANGNVKSTQGLISSNSNVSISVTKASSFPNGNDGNRVAYYAANIPANSDFAISNISVTGTSVGTGTITFGDAIFGDDNYNDIDLAAVTKNITVEPEVVQSDNNYLGSLSISNVSISFDRNTTSYNATIPYTVDSVNVSATPEDSTASITSGTGEHVMNTGLNTINIVVVAQNGESRTYTININKESRPLSSDATLKSLTVTGAYIGIFSPSTTTYSANVDNSVNSVSIAAEANDSNARVTGDLGNQTLYVSTNKFIITVTAENGVTTKKYTINITRGKDTTPTDLSSINTLSYLSVSNTKIASSFSSNKVSYSATVANSVSSVTISATPTDKKAAVSGKGTYQLKVGTNTFNVIVTAEDGSPNIYKITITRQSANNNNNNSNNNNRNNSSNTNTNSTTVKSKDNNSLLKELSINGKSIKLSDTSFAYKYTVLYEIDSLKIATKTQSDKAKVTINGEDNLQVGKNAVTITVTAEDGSTTMYVITVTRKQEEEKLSSDSTLNSVSIDKYDIDFDPKKYSYVLNIKNEKSLNISYEPSNSNSNVIIAGNEDLTNDSVISIIVTAEDGSTSKYTITIKKKSSPLKILLILLVILLLIGGGFLAYYILFVLKKNNKVEETPQEIDSFNTDINNEEQNNTETNDNIDNNELPFEKIDK